MVPIVHVKIMMTLVLMHKLVLFVLEEELAHVRMMVKNANVMRDIKENIAKSKLRKIHVNHWSLVFWLK